MPELRYYNVNPKDRAPLLAFMVDALKQAGCTIVRCASPREAPFRISFETALGERIGIIAYAFLSTFTPTHNRPDDEHTFQVKYGSKKDNELHEIWQDPFGLYTTLFLGINPQLGLFVAVDPVLNSPTKFFVRVEFKDEHVQRILSDGWHSWERSRRDPEQPTQVLVGGTAGSFLRLVRFEREARGLDQGHRQLLAERLVQPDISSDVLATDDTSASVTGFGSTPDPGTLHRLCVELGLGADEVLDLISNTRRLKMAVRGWVAEEHLVRHLERVPGVSGCKRLDAEGGPDVQLSFEGSAPILIECKNVLRQLTAGHARVDFMRTRASQGDPCSRYYQPSDFDVVAACLHAVSEKWEFRFVRASMLDPHPKCPGRLSNKVLIDERWSDSAAGVLRAASLRH